MVRSFVAKTFDGKVDATLKEFVVYEEESRKKRYGLSFEAAAIVWSSLVVSLLVLVVPWILPGPDCSLKKGLWWAGGIGCILPLLIESLY